MARKPPRHNEGFERAPLRVDLGAPPAPELGSVGTRSPPGPLGLLRAGSATQKGRAPGDGAQRNAPDGAFRRFPLLISCFWGRHRGLQKGRHHADVWRPRR